MCRVYLKHAQLCIQLQEYAHRYFIAEEDICSCIKPLEIGILQIIKLTFRNLITEGNFLFISQSSAFKLLTAANTKGNIRTETRGVYVRFQPVACTESSGEFRYRKSLWWYYNHHLML